MTLTGPRALIPVAVLAMTVFAAGCGAPEDTPATSSQGITTQEDVSTAQQPDETPSEPVRTRDEQAFLDDLTRLGVPTDSAAGTTVEVGIGICRGISEGAGADEILDHIRPITSALAARTGGRDANEVGRALVDASRAHLCG